MLRNVVQNFLDSIGEREFDAPLLAVLAAQGFTDIHFIHGAYEFGKDVIAKRVCGDGTVKQYAIQSKAGDLTQADWRAVRPQLEECFYNGIAHPAFDTDLPRVAVLVTTGRLKGAASADAQQFGKLWSSRGIGEFEFWDIDQFVNWISIDPSIGLAGADDADGLNRILTGVRDRTITEPALERHTRSWAVDGDPVVSRRACLEAAILCSALRHAHRLDLAALLALHLLRTSSQLDSDPGDEHLVSAAKQMFTSYATELLDQVEPLLDDARKLLRPVLEPMAIVTYPAMVCRVTEVVSLLALTTKDPDVKQRAEHATRRLCTDHPGAVRPPSDQFAASLIPAALVLRRADTTSARAYLRAVASWIIDRHDPAKDGLGLGSLDEDAEATTARLLGGGLTFESPERRYASYLTTVLLDLLLAFGENDLYTAVRTHVEGLRVVPTIVVADEKRARWRRGGPGVAPHPRVEYLPADQPRPPHHARTSGVDPVTALLLGATVRNRHYLDAITSLTTLPVVRS